jgi:DNA invertase Pin-like site-specific DNA recombinase
MKPKPKRVALYARISTRGGERQNLSNQFLELRKYSERMGWKVARHFYDEESGAEDLRPGLRELMTCAARREFEAVIVVDLSRLTRGGPAKAFEFIARLTACKVEFWSMNEELFRTAGPAGQLFIAIAAHVAEMERALLRDRVKAGLARARQEGRIGGRPRCVLDKVKLLEWRKEGKSLREIAEITKVGHDTIARRLREIAQQDQASSTVRG